MQTLPAVVRPRCQLPGGGESRLLLEAVLQTFERHDRGTVLLTGSDGSGKTTALRYLREHLPEQLQIDFFDSRDEVLPRDRQIIVTNASTPPSNATAVFELAPWLIDDCIEFAMARFPDAHQPLIVRFMAAKDQYLLNGNPELCTAVLCEFQDDEELNCVGEAIGRIVFRAAADSEQMLTEISELCLRMAQPSKQPARRQIRTLPESALNELGIDNRQWRWLRHSSVRLLLLPTLLVDRFDHDRQSRQNTARDFIRKIPSSIRRAVQKEVARRLSASAIEHVMRRLFELLSAPEASAERGFYLSILTRRNPKFRPEWLRTLKTVDSTCDRVCWDDINLKGASFVRCSFVHASLRSSLFREAGLTGSNFDAADLHGSVFSECRAAGATFRQANLTAAVLSHGNFSSADFTAATATQADFSGANLTNACLLNCRLRDCSFRNANLQSAELAGADLRGCDFTRADLPYLDLCEMNLLGTTFTHTKMKQARLDRVRWEQSDLSHAILVRASMTDAVVRHCNLSGADLAGAYMSGIDLCGSNLREANLSGVQFHFGSCRSGLVDSDLASEGTRTGFYLSDYDAHVYQAAEELRVANLRYCDLRGCRFEDTNFWRVDLRNAQMDPPLRDAAAAMGAFLD